MERAHLFMAGIVLVVVAVIGVIAGTARLQPERPEKSADEGTAGYNTFSNVPNLFESLRQNTENTPTVLSAGQPEDLQKNIQSIIAQWERRPGSSDARAARVAATQQVKTPEEIEREEISALFNDLIGPKVVDAPQQRHGYESLSNDDLIWGGGYSGTAATQQTTSLSATQQELKDYTNELASLLRNFNLAQGDQAGALEVFIETRSAASLKQLADAYVGLSTTISTLTPPASVASMHNGMVTSYKAVGELMWDLRLAEDDEALVARMLTYNEASADVARHHVAFITTLKAHGVPFESHEPGSDFTFSPTTGGGL